MDHHYIVVMVLTLRVRTEPLLPESMIVVRVTSCVDVSFVADSRWFVIEPLIHVVSPLKCSSNPH